MTWSTTTRLWRESAGEPGNGQVSGYSGAPVSHRHLTRAFLGNLEPGKPSAAWGFTCRCPYLYHRGGMVGGM